MNRQHRKAEISDVGGDGRTFSAMAVAYNVVDSFDTVFDPGCFTASLTQRMPTITWGHDWSEPIGRVTSYDDTPVGLVIHGRLSDPTEVPRARQAISQLKDGTIDDVSVGFSIEDGDETRAEEGKPLHFVKATLDEVACVLRGAVPGAKVLALRSAKRSVIEAEAAGLILAKLQSGTITLKDALQEVEDNAVAEPVEPDAEPETTEPTEDAADVEDAGAEEDDNKDDAEVETADDELETLLADADEALGAWGDH